MLEKEFTENSSNESLHLWRHETLIKGKSRCSQVFWCALEQVSMIRPTIIHGRALFYFQSFSYWLYLRASFTTHVLKKIELLLKTISVRHNLWHGWSSVITQSIIFWKILMSMKTTSAKQQFHVLKSCLVDQKVCIWLKSVHEEGQYIQYNFNGKSRNHEKHRNNIGIVNEVTLFFVIGFVMF